MSMLKQVLLPTLSQVDGRTQALLDHRLKLAQLPAADAAAALLLRGLMELCIYPPQPLSSTSSHAGTHSGSKTSSSDASGNTQGAGDLASDPAAERVAEAAAAAGSAFHTAEQQLGSKHAENSLPVSWSCTDEAVLQVHQLVRSSALFAVPGHCVLVYLPQAYHQQARSKCRNETFVVARTV